MVLDFGITGLGIAGLGRGITGLGIATLFGVGDRIAIVFGVSIGLIGSTVCKLLGKACGAAMLLLLGGVTAGANTVLLGIFASG